MNLTIMKKISNTFFISLLFLVLISSFTFWEIGKITSVYQDFSRQQGTDIEMSRQLIFYGLDMGKFRNETANSSYIKIVAIVITINIMVMLVVTFLLFFQENSRSIRDVLATARKVLVLKYSYKI